MRAEDGYFVGFADALERSGRKDIEGSEVMTVCARYDA